jgi:hypothetical protein
VPAPPAESSDQTRAELAELRLLQSVRSPLLNTAAAFWNGVPATQRWTELTQSLAGQYRIPGQYQSRLHAIVAALAQEAGQARLVAGANYRSDVTAGLALGAAVGEKAVARAKADGFDTKWTGSVPTGPGYWIQPQGVEPIAVTASSWKPWMMTSSSQFRSAPPPAFGSPEFKAGLDELKRINISLSPTERATAVWWGTMSAGHWQRVAHDLIARDKLSTPRAARILSFLNAALQDASIACFEAKYTYWTIRPYQADPTILPLIAEPSHPSYPAGAGCAWGAAGEVLAYYFPQDAARLHTMQQEAVTSRIFAGIHFRFDLEAGMEIARRVTELMIQRDRMNDQ